MDSRDRATVPVDDAQPSRPAQPAQPRQPSDLQGLLRFAMEATRNEDAPDAAPAPLDEERRRFLEDAISSLSVDATSELRVGIATLSDKDKISGVKVSDAMPEDVDEAFDSLENFVSHIDYAIGFYRLGGFSVFPVCLSCEHPAVRGAACRLLAELCQSNPFCQTRALECGYLRTLVDMCKTEEDADLLCSTVYGISCIVRHHDPCVRAFLDEGGLAGLRRALEKPSPALRAKAAFLIDGIFPESPDIANDLVATGTVKALADALPREYGVHSERILRALRTLADDPRVAEELRAPELDLTRLLADYLRSDELKEEDSEDRLRCESLLAIASDRGARETAVDR